MDNPLIVTEDSLPKISNKKKLEAVYKHVNETYLLQHYLGIFDLKKTHRNPLRKDNTPGCRFFSTREGVVLFHDYSKGKSYNWLSVLKEKGYDYDQAVDKAYKEFGKPLSIPKRKKIEEVQTTLPAFSVLFQVVPKDFTEKELNYWKDYGITETLLKKFWISSAASISKYSDEERKFKVLFKSTESQPIFVYLHTSGKIKIYRPKSDKKTKWRANVSREDISGAQVYTKSSYDYLIITSSLKDAMCLHSMGYNAISLQSEGAKVTPSIRKWLRSKTKKVIVFYDADEAGIENTNKLLEENKRWKSLSLPSKFTSEDCKDISDFYKKYGRKKTKFLMSLLTKNLIK